MSFRKNRGAIRAATIRAAMLALLASIGAASMGPAADPREALVSPFLASVKGKLLARGAEEAFRGEVRVLLRDIESQAASQTTDLPARRQRVREARDALAAGLAQEMGAVDGLQRAGALVEKAAKEQRQARIDVLERGIICWCPDESFTRTLAGCAQGCANEQKALIREWLEEGATDSEIIDHMVADPRGGPKVRAMPEAKGVNWVGYLGPAILTVAGAVLVVVLLRRMTRRGPPRSAASSGPAGGEDDVGEQIERELRQMEGS